MENYKVSSVGAVVVSNLVWKKNMEKPTLKIVLKKVDRNKISIVTYMSVTC